MQLLSVSVLVILCGVFLFLFQCDDTADASLSQFAIKTNHSRALANVIATKFFRCCEPYHHDGLLLLPVQRSCREHELDGSNVFRSMGQCVPVVLQ